MFSFSRPSLPLADFSQGCYLLLRASWTYIYSPGNDEVFWEVKRRGAFLQYHPIGSCVCVWPASVLLLHWTALLSPTSLAHGPRPSSEALWCVLDLQLVSFLGRGAYLILPNQNWLLAFRVWKHTGSLLLFSLLVLEILFFVTKSPNVGWGSKLMPKKTGLLSSLLYLVAWSKTCGKEGRLERRSGGEAQRLTLSSQTSCQGVNVLVM